MYVKCIAHIDIPHWDKAKNYKAIMQGNRIKIFNDWYSGGSVILSKPWDNFFKKVSKKELHSEKFDARVSSVLEKD